MGYLEPCRESTIPYLHFPRVSIAHVPLVLSHLKLEPPLPWGSLKNRKPHDRLDPKTQKTHARFGKSRYRGPRLAAQLRHERPELRPGRRVLPAPGVGGRGHGAEPPAERGAEPAEEQRAPDIRGSPEPKK